MVLMEILCAIMIFGMAALGLMRALTVSAQNAIISQQQLRMLLRLQSKLTEYSKYPKIDEIYESNPVSTTDPDDFGVSTRTEIIKLDKLETPEPNAQPMNDMYQIVVTASYEDFGHFEEVKASTIRYAKLYATTTSGGGAAIPTPVPTR